MVDVCMNGHDVEDAKRPLLDMKDINNAITRGSVEFSEPRFSECDLQKSFDTTESAFPLSFYLSQSFSSKLYIHIFLLNWDFHTMDQNTAIVVGVYYLCVICVVLYVSTVVYMFIATSTTIDTSIIENRTQYFAVLYVFVASLTSQLISTFLSSFYVARRVSRPALQEELQYYRPAMKMCIIFSSFFIVVVILGAIFEFRQYSVAVLTVELMATITLTVVTSGTVSINLLFVIVDTMMCESILQKIALLAERQELAVAELQLARKEITRRVQDFLVPNAIMACNAVICLVTFVLALFFSEFTSTGTYLLGISWYFKEIVYLFIALYLSARLNGLADQIQENLGDNMWDNTLEMQRIQAFVNLQAKPFAFRLLWTRPTRHTVAWQLISVITALILSFARGLYTSY